ncbi:MAG TPA: hypothetical protein DDY13_15660 [Cytophagales bacterium]|nr:hypothetical protein [Cytophagales bacterium]
MSTEYKYYEIEKNNLMKLLLNHNIVFFFVIVFLVSWSSWILAYLLFPGNFLLQLPLMRIGAFAPALISIFMCSLKNSAESNKTKKRWLTFVIVWIIASLHFYFYLIHIENTETGIKLILITIVTSVLPAFVLSNIFSKKTAIQEHLSTIFYPKGKLFWYIIAFLIIPFLLSLDVLINYIIGNEIGSPEYNFNEYANIKLFFYLFLIIITQSLQTGGLSEEPGWRGYAQKELQKKYSPLIVGIMIGLAWGIWHFPIYLSQITSMSLWMIVLGCIQIGLTFTWIYNRTKGSLLAVIILHASWNTFTHFIPKSSIFDIVMGIFLLIVICTSKMWKKTDKSNNA